MPDGNRTRDEPMSSGFEDLEGAMCKNSPAMRPYFIAIIDGMLNVRSIMIG